MHEVEAKLRLGAELRQQVLARLRGLGAVQGPTQVQSDRYFGHPQRDFAATDEALRLRTIVGESDETEEDGRGGTKDRPGNGGEDGRSESQKGGSERAGRQELTYKGPRAGGPLKSRLEETVQLGGDPSSLLQALGFRAVAEVRKRRMTWTLGAGDGGEGDFASQRVEVALDEVEGLGAFLEVEAMGENVSAASEAVERVLESLGLAEVPRVAESYLELMGATESRTKS